MKEARQIPDSQILDNQLISKTSERTERVLIVRDSGFMGSSLEAIIQVNRKPVVSLNTSEAAVFYLSPGKYMFSIVAKKNYLGEPPGESEIEIQKNGLNNFRLRLIPGDGPRIERSQYLE
jgi:hypothetical protein